MTNDSKKILIVDDETDVLTYLSSLLEDNGYTAVTAQDGREGMDIVKREHPQLITLDISMPEETGVRMLRNLHDDPETCDIPVIIITGIDPRFEDFIKNRKQVTPPAAFFEKPIDKESFILTVKNILG